MKIKAVLLDFDGTIVKDDLLSMAVEINGKGDEDSEIREGIASGKYKGVEGLTARVNLLKGLKVSELEEMLEDYRGFFSGTAEFSDFMKENGLFSAIISGNIMLILEFFQRKYNISAVYGTGVDIEDGIIQGISKEAPPVPSFKTDAVEELKRQYDLSRYEMIGIGDSIRDLKMLEYTKYKIGMCPKEGLSEHVDYVVTNFYDVLEIINTDLK